MSTRQCPENRRPSAEEFQRLRDVEKRLVEWGDMERHESLYAPTARRSTARWLLQKIDHCLNGGTP
jgi:hypothetical protein